MQLDDLKTTWEREITMKSNMTEFDNMRRRVDKFDRRAKVAWALELFACAGVVTAIVLKWLAWSSSEELNLLVQLGMLTGVVCCTFVALKIVLARRVMTTDDWTLSSKINIQIEKREKETKLLNTAAYWYLTPIFIAVILGSYGGFTQRTGSYIPDTALLIYWTVCLALYIGIYFFHRYHVKTKVQPVLDQLYALRRELES